MNTRISQRTGIINILLAKRLSEIQVVSHQSNYSITNLEHTIFWHSFELKIYVYIKCLKDALRLERGTHIYK